MSIRFKVRRWNREKIKIIWPKTAQILPDRFLICTLRLTSWTGYEILLEASVETEELHQCHDREEGRQQFLLLYYAFSVGVWFCSLVPQEAEHCNSLHVRWQENARAGLRQMEWEDHDDDAYLFHNILHLQHFCKTSIFNGLKPIHGVHNCIIWLPLKSQYADFHIYYFYSQEETRMMRQLNYEKYNKTRDVCKTLTSRPF